MREINRIPIRRVESDDTITYGTAQIVWHRDGFELSDFCDLYGKRLRLQPGARFETNVDLPGWFVASVVFS